MVLKPHRKPNRLIGYDYCANGCYFITICTKDHICHFGSVVVDKTNRAHVVLTNRGKVFTKNILALGDCFPSVLLESFIVMPNHAHLMLLFESDTDGREGIEVSRIVRSLKAHTSVDTGQRFFQKSFHDHIVRNEADHQRLLEYIENNPAQWALDRYFRE